MELQINRLMGRDDLFETALNRGEEQAMQYLQDLESPLRDREAGACLLRALQDGSAELFGTLLDHCAVEEYVNFWQLYTEKDSLHNGINGYGTLLMLAAMMDRPRHAAILLQAGFDCNGAGLAVAAASGMKGVVDLPPYIRCCGTFGGHLSLNLQLHQEMQLCISYPTPLAAALLCGSLATAQVLLDQPGIWKGESSAVCRAAAMVLEGMTQKLLSPQRQQDQREILRLIFCPERRDLPDRDTFLRTCYLRPASFADICRGYTFACQMESGLCTREDAEASLEVLDHRSTWMSDDTQIPAITGKLLAIKRSFPALCREGWVKDLFLRECLRHLHRGQSPRMLLAAWKQLSGKERDLTPVGESMGFLSYQALHAFLKEAGEGGELIMDADSIISYTSLGIRAKMELLRRVRFRRREGGVSELIRGIFLFADLREVRCAAEQGLLQQEDPDALMTYLTKDHTVNHNARAAVLTYACSHQEGSGPVEQWQDMRRWAYWSMWDQEDIQEDVNALFVNRLPQEECLWRMFRVHQYLSRGFAYADFSSPETRYSNLQGKSLVGLACCARSGQMLELLLTHLPQALRETVEISWDRKLQFLGTPLALAAAMGRTEQVELLLAHGAQADETGRGDRSWFYVHNGTFFSPGLPVTPLLAALLFGEEETARLLVQHGARMDFTRREYRRVLRISPLALPLAEKLLGRAVDGSMEGLFSAEEERTLGAFWKNLSKRKITQGDA